MLRLLSGSTVACVSILLIGGVACGDPPSPLVGRLVMVKASETRLHGSETVARATPGEIVRVSESRGELLRLPQGWVHRDAVVSAEAAVEHFTLEIAARPTVFAYSSRCRALIAQGEYQRAIDDCDAILALEPRRAATFANRGWLQLQLGEFELAVNDLSQAIELDPKHAENYAVRGLACLESGDARASIEDFDRALALNPGLATAWNNRGTAWLDLGQHQKALADFNRAIELDPAARGASYNPYYNRGRTLAVLGKHREAVAEFTRALELDPEYAPAYLGRAESWDALGNEERSTADYREAVRLDPNSPLPRA